MEPIGIEGYGGYQSFFLSFQACRIYHHLSVGSSYFDLMTLPYWKIAAVSWICSGKTISFQINCPSAYQQLDLIDFRYKNWRSFIRILILFLRQNIPDNTATGLGENSIH